MRPVPTIRELLPRNLWRTTREEGEGEANCHEEEYTEQEGHVKPGGYRCEDRGGQQGP